MTFLAIYKLLLIGHCSLDNTPPLPSMEPTINIIVGWWSGRLVLLLCMRCQQPQCKLRAFGGGVIGACTYPGVVRKYIVWRVTMLCLYIIKYFRWFFFAKKNRVRGSSTMCLCRCCGIPYNSGFCTLGAFGDLSCYGHIWTWRVVWFKYDLHIDLCKKV